MLRVKPDLAEKEKKLQSWKDAVFQEEEYEYEDEMIFPEQKTLSKQVLFLLEVLLTQPKETKYQSSSVAIPAIETRMKKAVEPLPNRMANGLSKPERSNGNGHSHNKLNGNKAKNGSSSVEVKKAEVARRLTLHDSLNIPLPKLEEKKHLQLRKTLVLALEMIPLDSQIFLIKKLHIANVGALHDCLSIPGKLAQQIWRYLPKECTGSSSSRAFTAINPKIPHNPEQFEGEMKWVMLTYLAEKFR